jgi:hypothetical protein
VNQRVIISTLLLTLAACRPSGSTGDGAEGKNMPSISEVLQRHTDSLMALPGVIGVGRGEKNGSPTVYVMVERLSDSLRRALPDSIEGYAVDVVESGKIRAQPE